MPEDSPYPTDPVDERELQSALVNRLRGWRLSDNVLERTFKLRDFKAAMELVQKVGERAEDIQHHPDIDIRYNRVKFAVTSHDAGRITRRDLFLAGYIDELASNYEVGREAA
jgi:4a-hydroxytetrahydrobiopterin dehydratase